MTGRSQTTGVARPLRIGGVPYLNGQPLTAWFESGECDAPVEYITAAPSRLVQMLEAGQLDVALASSVAAITNPGLYALPDMGIGCDGPVRSVRVFSKVPIHRIRRLAADSSSLTSAALARGILQECYGLTPNIVSESPDRAALLEDADAVMLIGDRALIGLDTPYDLDLGAAWKEHTGLPFVFAVWLVNDVELGRRSYPLLYKAKQWGSARIEAIARDWSAATGMPELLATEYLAKVMKYNVGDQERVALERFSRMCLALGLCDLVARMRFVAIDGNSGVLQ